MDARRGATARSGSASWRTLTVVFAAVVVITATLGAASPASGELEVPTGGVHPAQAGQPTLRLPWAPGEIGRLGSRTNPVHGTNDGAIDFIPSSGIVRAAGGGQVSRPCANTVRIDHGGGWFTEYYHLVDIRMSSGPIEAGDVLGRISEASGCGGRADGAHVHFSLRRSSGPASIDGLQLSSWTVRRSACGGRGGMVHVSGTTACANGQMSYTQPSVPEGSAAWVPAPPSDFDGNGVDDIFFYGPGRAADRVRWGTTPGTFATDTASESVDGSYTPLPGDFNGDGATDIVWYGPGGAADALWAGRPGQRTFTKNLALSITGTYRPFVGDFDGNAIDDIFFYGPGGEPDRVRWGTTRGSFATATTAVTVNRTYTPLSGDFNGDGASDVVWYGPGGAPDAQWAGRLGLRSFVTTIGTNVNGTYRPF